MQRGEVFAGTQEGVFRSVDQGEHWANISTGLTSKIIYSLAIDSDGYLYAGTESGVFRSEDNGDSWVPSNVGISNSYVSSLAINASGHLFAGTFSGIFRSTNNGNEWTEISSGLKDSSIISLAVNSQGYIFAGSRAGVFRSRKATIGSVRGMPGEIPGSFILEQNYPNPFNFVTTLRFSLPRSERAVVKVHNLLGQTVATLVSEEMAAGRYEIDWNAGDFPSGVYLCRLQIGDSSTIRRLTLVK